MREKERDTATTGERRRERAKYKKMNSEERKKEGIIWSGGKGEVLEVEKKRERERIGEEGAAGQKEGEREEGKNRDDARKSKIEKKK
jgi:hypothetical protein